MQKLTTGGEVDPNEWYVKHGRVTFKLCKPWN